MAKKTTPAKQAPAAFDGPEDIEAGGQVTADGLRIGQPCPFKANCKGRIRINTQNTFTEGEGESKLQVQKTHLVCSRCLQGPTEPVVTRTPVVQSQPARLFDRRKLEET